MDGWLLLLTLGAVAVGLGEITSTRSSARIPEAKVGYIAKVEMKVKCLTGRSSYRRLRPRDRIARATCAEMILASSTP